MNLLKLTLNNFRIFYGERVIEFSNDSNKNVTLVHAENGMGKTTMLNAIKWCLYSRAPDFEDEGKDSRMLNYISNEEG
ncbi:MAG: AAA family ATPase, partial [Bdellovibrionales bacterium]|nr:AAA family ATPase [Bdellovibrionales bacterium]